MLTLYQFFAWLGWADACPVCKKNPPEYWGSGRVQKYRNGCCSTRCYKRSPEYIAPKEVVIKG